MPVGKARSATEKSGDEGFEFAVPCFTSIDEARIRDHSERDHFFWLDLTAPSHEDLSRLRPLFGFHPSRSRTPMSFSSAQSSTAMGITCFSCFTAPGATAPRTPAIARGPHVHLCPVPRDDPPRPAAGARSAARRARRARPSQRAFLLYACWTASPTASSRCSPKWTTRSTTSRRRCSPTTPTSSSSACSGSSASSSRCARWSPQRDIFARSIDELAELPGLELDERAYFRDIYDHLIRISDLIDSYRDLLSGATDLYLSTVSNRQNGVMKQLTVIATIFLPLSFITGFFGRTSPGWSPASRRHGRSGGSAWAACSRPARACWCSSSGRVGCRPSVQLVQNGGDR